VAVVSNRLAARNKRRALWIDNLSLIKYTPKHDRNMKRLLTNTVKTVASALAVCVALSSASYAGQTRHHHRYTTSAPKKHCRQLFLFWRSCTYSYVGANQVSKTRAKLPNSEIAVGFYTGSIFADSTGRPARKSSSALWGSTSTDVRFSGGSTFGSTHGSATDGTTRGSLAGNSEQQGGGASNQPSRGQETASSSPSSPSGGGSGSGSTTEGNTGGSTSTPSDNGTPSGGTGSSGGGLGKSTPTDNNDPVGDGAGKDTTSSTPSDNNQHDNNGHGNGDQNAPGNSGDHNNAENSEHSGQGNSGQGQGQGGGKDKDKGKK